MRKAERYRGSLGLLVGLLLLTGASLAEGRDFEGMIEASETVAVASQVPGVIDEILVERGDLIKTGDIIARLKSRVEAAAVVLAEARVEFGRRKSLRNDELSRKRLISIHEKDEMETELQLSQLELQETEERFKLRTIISPIDGIVVTRAKSAGEYVGEDPILTLARIDPLYVEVIMPLQHFGQIKKGMRGEVLPEAPVGGKFSAEVIIVDRVVDAASGTFGVRLQLPNSSLKVPAGIKCRVRFPGV